MKLLAWDTSSKTGAIVALEWSNPSEPQNGSQSQTEAWQQVKLVSELTINVDSTHSEQLLWGIHQVLQSARWKLSDVDVIGVGTGPGNFTGLRIGVTTARTLAHTLKKPIVSVSSLAALAYPVSLHFCQKGLEQTLVIAATDACKGELFALWAGREEVIRPEALVRAIREQMDQSRKPVHWVVVGEGRRRYLEEWQKLPGLHELQVPMPFTHAVQGRYLGYLVWQAHCAGLIQEPLSVHPRYLRASDAELKLKARLGS